MSRIGKKPITLPKGVDVKFVPGQVHIKGPKGELSQAIDPSLEVKVEDGNVLVLRPNDERRMRAQHGLARTLIFNMVTGVTEGFTRSLQIIGVGYRATQQGKGIQLQLGHSHPINIDPIPGIEFEVEVDNRAKINKVHIRGTDKQKVGQVAANLRGLRPPEPYKGKGMRYVDEVVQRKMGKAGKA
ncbi:MAG: 50S ribosomal protein L6 [Armatimonadetes bacterium]|nr:50S ribosomal protein L6 [Armatimonadota bacterium]